jgi:hypothetical protein
MAFKVRYKGEIFVRQKGGSTYFLAREKENSINWGNFVHFRGSESLEIVQTSPLGT